MRRTMLLRLDGDDEEAEPKEVSSILLLLLWLTDKVAPADGEGSA